MSTDTVLQAVVQAAADAAQAEHGWLAAVGPDDTVVVVAAAGPSAATLLGATAAAGQGASGFVASSGQPLALTTTPDDPRVAEGLAGRLPTPPGSVLCVPCEGDDGVVGTLELVGRRGGGGFSFDDIELVTLLAGIAGVALTARPVVAPERDPARLAVELGELAQEHPERYDALEALVAGLLGTA